jgi:hypothetical protein
MPLRQPWRRFAGILGAWSATYGVDGGFQQPFDLWKRKVGDEDERVAARCRELRL